MIAPIDFSAMFRASVAEKLRVAGDIDEDAAEALAETLYAEWAQTPDERLNGLSPRAWFARLATPEALTELLTAYARENVEIPELLLERFDDLGAGCAPRLEALARNVEAPPIARAQAFDLLLGFDGERPWPWLRMRCWPRRKAANWWSAPPRPWANAPVRKRASACLRAMRGRRSLRKC